MIFPSRLFKLLVSLILSVAIIFSGLVPVVGQIYPAYAADVVNYSREADSKFVPITPAIDIYQLDQSLLNAYRRAHDVTEEFAAVELDYWIDDLMQKVDDKFLNWYFSYGNQKAMEFGIPFALLVFTGDYSLNFLRKEDDKRLNPNDVLKNKMIEDFQNKFTELVLNPESAQKFLYQLTERVARNYASALAIQLATIKNAYKIPDGEWERYLNDLAAVVYDTGNSQYSLSPESLISSLVTKSIIVTTAGIGGKLALNFSAKVAAKIGTKAGGALAAKVTAQFVDPLLGIGLLIWDTWDYKRTVDESRPVLRQHILEYLNEVKMSIFNAPDNSIMAAIEEVESKNIAELESRLTSY